MQPKLGAQSSCCQELAPVHGAHASMTLAEASPEGALAVCVLDATLEHFRGELLRAGHRSAATLDLCSRGAQASSLCNQIAQVLRDCATRSHSSEIVQPDCTVPNGASCNRIARRKSCGSRTVSL